MDIILPMDYQCDIKLFESVVKPQIEAIDGRVPICIMIGVYESYKPQDSFSTPVQLVDFVDLTRKLGADGFAIWYYENTLIPNKFLPALRKGITSEDTYPPYLNPEVDFKFEGIPVSCKVVYGEGQTIKIDVSLSTKSRNRKPIKEAEGKIEFETISGEKLSSLGSIEASAGAPGIVSLELSGLTKGTYRLAVYGEIIFEDGEKREWTTRSRFIHVGAGEMRTKTKLESLPCYQFSHPVTIDGELDEWKEIDPISLGKREQLVPSTSAFLWNGPGDLSVKAYLGWDREYFYFAAKVKDDNQTNIYTGANIWDGDCIQIAFDTLNDALEGTNCDNNDYEYGLALTNKEGIQLYRWTAPPGKKKGLIKDIPLVIKREDGYTNYELAIPWKELEPFQPKKAKTIGFSFVVFDDDGGSGHKYWIKLTDGIAGAKAPFLFRDVVLREAKFLFAK